MANLRQLSDDVTALFIERAKRVGEASLWVKIVLVLGGSAMIAAAQCATLPLMNKAPVWTTVGLGGTFFAAVGGLFLTFTEQNNARELWTAREALEAAREAAEDFAQIGLYAEEIRRSTQLYGAVRLMVTALQKMAFERPKDIGALATGLLDVAEHPLRVAMGFQTADHWTIGVYQIQPRASGRVLASIAQLRSEKCDPTKAREWKEGIGAGWIAVAKGSDAIIPDLSAIAMGSLFEGAVTEADIKKYRSIAVSPIIVGAEKWGIVIATSDCPDHFSLEETHGSAPAEAVRALQSLITLALSARNLQAPHDVDVAQ